MLPLAAAMAEAARSVRKCGLCGNLDSRDPCSICTDPERDRSLLCVVEGVGDLWALERAGVHRGLYHVLGGTLSALAGTGPEDLNVAPLLARVAEGELREVILALGATVDGATTAHWLTDRLRPLGVTVTRVGQGVPMGGALDVLDDGTFGRSPARAAGLLSGAGPGRSAALRLHHVRQWAEASIRNRSREEIQHGRDRHRLRRPPPRSATLTAYSLPCGSTFWARSRSRRHRTRAKLEPSEVDEVILGQILTAAQGQNRPARQAARAASDARRQDCLRRQASSAAPGCAPWPSPRSRSAPAKARSWSPAARRA